MFHLLRRRILPLALRGVVPLAVVTVLHCSGDKEPVCRLEFTGAGAYELRCVIVRAEESKSTRKIRNLQKPTRGYYSIYAYASKAHSVFFSTNELLFCGCLFEGAEELDELTRGNFGLYEIAIGLVLDVDTDVIALLKVGRNDNLAVEFWRLARVAERAKYFYTGDVWHHEVE